MSPVPPDRAAGARRAALDGVKLIEFSSHLGAAYAAMLLAEQGAYAIRIERPGQDAGRGTPHFHVLNRSKRSLSLDPGSKAGAIQVAELIRWADLVVTGYTSARSRELRLDYDSIRAVNPRALLVSMPPCGSRGPLANIEASDEMIQALGGLAGNQFTRSGDPAPVTFPLASYSAGALAATAAVAALIGRGANGNGQSMEVSLLAGALSLQTGSIVRHPKLAALYAEGSNDPLGPIPSFRLFEAGDGRYLFVACGSATFWNKFALAIDRADLVADPRFEGAPWGCQDHWQTLKQILEATIRTRSRDEWLELLTAGDVPCAPVLSRQNFIEDEQVRFMGMRREVDDPVLGPTVQMGVPISLRATPGDIVSPAPLDSGSNAAQLMASAPRMQRLPRDESPIGSRDKSPLAGTTVLDFTSYIAGSYGTMILAQMGAQVVKIESIEGDPVRHLALAFLGWNQGKRSMSINLGTAEGREIVHELVKKADIVVENLRPGRMRKLGLDYAALAAINPRIIYMSVTAFGSDGPRCGLPGFDPLLQARSGAQAAQGGHHGHPVYLTCALCDYGAATLSALGCVLALYARHLTGRGQMCETSLLQAAMAFQAGEFIFYRGRPDMEDGDAEYRGSSALGRCYRSHDGKSLFIRIAEPSRWDAMRGLCNALEPIAYAEAAGEPPNGPVASMLSSYFAALERCAALRILEQAGISAVPVNRIKDLFAEPQIASNRLLADLVHPQWGNLTQTGILAQFSALAPSAPGPAPTLGQHTDEILSTNLGYDDGKIKDLRKRGLIR